MKKIPYLKKGDLVCLLSPAKAIENDKVEYAKNLWEKNGFKVEIGVHALKKENYFSASAEERVSDFNSAIIKHDVKAIICNRGGYGCIHLYDNIDWITFEKNPKWIVGFSDVTVFHLLLQNKGFPSIHATMPLNYASNTKKSINSLFKSITGEKLIFNYKSDKYNINGECKGIAVGGNLSIINSLLFYLPLDFFKDKILIIEEVGEYIYQIDRMFCSLKIKGVFNEIKGLIVGGITDLKDTNPIFGKNIKLLIKEYLINKKIPLSFNFPFGHIDNNYSVTFGKEIFLKVTQNECEVVQ